MKTRFVLFGMFLFSLYTIFATEFGIQDLFLNPVPNQPPYQVVVGEKTFFNPFAIREVRFALNDLINRQYISEHFAGFPPIISPMGNDDSFFYGEEKVWSELGISVEGNKNKGLSAITQAMSQASALSENVNRLKRKTDGFWYFDEEKIAVNIYVRTDEVRNWWGDYFISLLEEAGISANKIPCTLGTAAPVVYYSDPALFEWSAYTESWGGDYLNIFYKKRSAILNQMFSSLFGFMPGGKEPDIFWTFYPELDAKARELANGIFFSELEMKNLYLEIFRMGLIDAIRIFLIGEYIE